MPKPSLKNLEIDREKFIKGEASSAGRKKQSRELVQVTLYIPPRLNAEIDRYLADEREKGKNLRRSDVAIAALEEFFAKRK